MDELEIVVAHSGRTTLKIGSTFLKVDSDQGRADRKLHDASLPA